MDFLIKYQKYSREEINEGMGNLVKNFIDLGGEKWIQIKAYHAEGVKSDREAFHIFKGFKYRKNYRS